MRRLRWDVPEPARPRHRFRDTVLVYAFIAGLLVAVTALTGGSVVRGVIVGAAVFVAAVPYSWWRMREKQQRQEGGKE